MKKRMLSAVLAAIMVLSMLPASAAAGAEKSAIDTSITAEWKNFRNSDVNMGITATKTPKDPASAELKWTNKIGVGWSDQPSVQIIVDNCLIVMYGKTISKLNLTSGEIIASGSMVTEPNWGYTPPTYAQGLIFAPLSDGKIQAFNAKDLTSVWVYTDPLGGQSLSPITYSDGFIYTGFWGSETKVQNYVCLSITDDDPARTDEAKVSTWHKEITGGVYWAGSVAVGGALIFGTDNGVANSDAAAHLYSVNKSDGTVISDLEISGDQRSTIAYSVEKGRVYFTTKAGLLYSAALDAASGVLSDLKSASCQSPQSTCTPIVYGDKVYLTVGSGVSSSTTSGNFVVADADTLSLLYTVGLKGYPQGSLLLSTAYMVSEGKLYFYSTYNNKPGGISLIKVDPSQNTAAGAELVEVYNAKGYENYCITSIICDLAGTLYYKNDTGNIFAVARNTAYLTNLSANLGMGLEDFSGATANYELVVPAETTSVTLTATACDGATVLYNGADSGSIALTNSAAKANIVVSKDGDTRTYKVNIRPASADAKLVALKVSESNAYTDFKPLTPEFVPQTETYACFGMSEGRSFVNIWPDAADHATLKVYPVSNVDPNRVEGDGTIKIAALGEHNRYAVYFADNNKPAVVRIEVNAEDGSTVQNYKLALTKTASGDTAFGTGLSLSAPETLTVLNQAFTLTATPTGSLGSGAAEVLNWSSSDIAVAAVSATGKVMCMGPGEATITAKGTLTSASCKVTSTAPAGNYLIVSAYDYNAGAAKMTGASKTGIIMEQPVSVPVGTAAAEAVKKAFELAGVPITMADTGFGPYLSAVNGLGAGEGMSGWMLAYNNDDFTNLGLSKLALNAGDRLNFHYSANINGTTDDIGHGWYGLPILTTLTLAGRSATMSKQSVTDTTSWITTTSYYIHGNQGAKVPMQGKGTQAEPFLIPITVPKNTDLEYLEASYTATLGEHYRVTADLEGAQDYRTGHLFTIASLGGKYKTWYKVLATRESDGGGGITPSKDISVSFRLIGATRSSKDTDLGLGTGDAIYQNWMKTATYKLPKNSSVHDLFTSALDQAGLQYVGADKNYISAIYAPAGYGGYRLSEFTNGPRSGWMYTVNGAHPGYGLKEWKLKDGDKVVWHYINDYSYEVKDWFGDASYPTLGNEKTWNLWLKAEDKNPPTLESGNSPTEKPVEKPTGTPETLKPTVTADKNGSASITVSQRDSDAALAAVKKNNSSALVISPEVKGDAKKVQVSLPKTAVSGLAEGTKAALTLESKVAKISLSTAALTTIAAEKGSEVSITAERVTTDKMSEENKALVGDHPLYNFSVNVGSNAVHEFGGTVTVNLPYTPKEGEDSRKITVFYIDKNGKAVEMPGAHYDAASGSIVFETTHFSTFAVVYDESKVIFTDVKVGDWYYDAVNYVTNRKLFSGTSQTGFSPLDDMSRAMVWTVLYRMAGTPEKTDATGWYDDAQRWAQAQKISDGSNPTASVSRQELATILYRYEKAEATAMDLSAFADRGQIADWAEPAVCWAVNKGLLTGRNASTLDPSGSASRAEVAAVLQRMETRREKAKT